MCVRVFLLLHFSCSPCTTKEQWPPAKKNMSKCPTGTRMFGVSGRFCFMIRAYVLRGSPYTACFSHDPLHSSFQSRIDLSGVDYPPFVDIDRSRSLSVPVNNPPRMRCCWLSPARRPTHSPVVRRRRLFFSAAATPAPVSSLPSYVGCFQDGDPRIFSEEKEVSLTKMDAVVRENSDTRSGTARRYFSPSVSASPSELYPSLGVLYPEGKLRRCDSWLPSSLQPTPRRVFPSLVPDNHCLHFLALLDLLLVDS